MSRRAELILPSAAMPWGRWVEGSNGDTAAAIERMKNDPNSAGNQFAKRVDNTARQIKAISVSTITELPLPDFSGNVSGAIGSFVNVVSSTYSVTAPTQTSSSALAIFNFRITSSSGVAPSLPMIKVNGQQFSDVGASPMRPPTNTSVGMYSVMGNVPITPGQSVTLQYGAAGSTTGSTYTLSFDLATVWVAFFGGL